MDVVSVLQAKASSGSALLPLHQPQDLSYLPAACLPLLQKRVIGPPPLLRLFFFLLSLFNPPLPSPNCPPTISILRARCCPQLLGSFALALDEPLPASLLVPVSKLLRPRSDSSMPAPAPAEPFRPHELWPLRLIVTGFGRLLRRQSTALAASGRVSST